MSDARTMHVPVLLHETIEYLDPKPGQFLIDGTVDGGGHAAELLKRLAPGGTLLGVDADESFLQATRARLSNETQNLPTPHPSFLLERGNYADLPEIIERQKLGLADGLFLDLGFSSLQVEESGRGFSFLKDEPLLMTYDEGAVPVKMLLRQMAEAELADVIYQYSGERYSRVIAKAIKERLKSEPIDTTGQLVQVIEQVLPKRYERGRIHRATRTFQALRMYANDELGNLKNVLAALPRIVRPGGRVAIITFHSLEDKIVKDHFRLMQKEKRATALMKKPVPAAAAERRQNPRSRSAKLRAMILS